jgi:hypothetical protein
LRFVEPKIHPHWADQFVNGALADNKYLAVRNGGSVRFKAVPLMGKTSLLIACKNSGPAPTYITIRQGTKTGPIVTRLKLDTTLQEKYAKPKGLWSKGWAYAFYTIPSLPGKQDLVWEFTNTKTKPDQNTASIGFWMMIPEVPAQLKSTAFQKIAYQIISASPETTTPVMLENPLEFTRPTRLFNRGSWLNQGQEVTRGIPALFSKKPVSNRLELAEWMGGKENPLTARVAVNRFWEQLFGTGIVETLEDMGSQGLNPVNQGLLDHLAYQFQYTFKYQPKELLKYIVMSASYQQSSVVSEKDREKDPYNRYITRGPRIRLNPEQLRDQALLWSGILSTKLGGPSVMPDQPDGIWNAPYSGMQWLKSDGEDQWRRSLYTYWRRSSPYPTMVSFDAGTRDVCLSRRIRTNTPMQALNTLNDPVFIEASQFFARKYPITGAEFIKKGYLDLFGKPISENKLAKLNAFYANMLAYYSKNNKEWSAIRQQSFEELDLSKLIAHSVAIKEAVVLEDPKEAGLRKILNFGHTLGHAIETYLLDKGKRKILHGEAIAIGMIVEAFISHQRDLISLQELEEIESYLFENYGRVKLHTEEISKIIALTAQDKKNKGKEIRFSLLTGLGDCGYDIPVSASEMKKAIQYYLN